MGVVLFNTRVRLRTPDEPEWVSVVLEASTKPNQTTVQSFVFCLARDYFLLPLMIAR